MQQRRAAATTIDTWPPPDPEARARVLADVAAGRARLSRAALAALAGEGAAGISANLVLNVDAAVALALDDAALYAAVAARDAVDPRATARMLAAHALLAQRVVGYGQYLLTGAAGDPARAWRPMGVWVLTTAMGWATLRRRLVFGRAEAAALAVVERRSAPWARRFNALAYTAGALGQADMQTLLELAAARGGWSLRLRARGALALAQRWAQAREAARRAQAEADVLNSTGARYPDLIPIEHFNDVPAPTVGRV